MLSILVAATSFPRWAGDSRGTFIWEGCRALAALGARVRVIAPHAAGAKTREAWEGVEIFRPRYGMDRGELLLETPGGLPVLWKNHPLGRLAVFPFFVSHASAIARLARECDLIHAHWTLSAFAARIGAPFHRRPVICTVQGSDIYQAMGIPGLGAPARWTLRGARKVIALSRSLAGAAAAQGVDPQNITVIPNGVDAERFSPNGIPREPVILFAGSLIERKGVGILVEALGLIRRRFPAERLVVIGDGPLRTRLAADAERAGVSDSVLFTGALPPAEVAAWMRRAELFVLPSLEEGQGVAMLEALASGTPCVASRVGGIPDILDPAWGALVPPGDPFALANAAADILGRADRGRAQGRAAARGVRNRYDWPAIARRILEVYSETLSRPVSPVGKYIQV